MKKKLNANAIVLDLRRLTEETLSAYEHISLNAVITLTNPRAQALLSQYDVKLNTVLCKNLPDDADIRASVTNGKTTLSAASKPDAKQVLVINGKVTVLPDAAETLRQYEALVVNGKATCPASLAALFTEAATVNGKLVIYPDEAVVLSGRSVKLDRAALRRRGPEAGCRRAGCKGLPLRRAQGGVGRIAGRDAGPALHRGYRAGHPARRHRRGG